MLDVSLIFSDFQIISRQFSALLPAYQRILLLLRNTEIVCYQIIHGLPQTEKTFRRSHVNSSSIYKIQPYSDEKIAYFFQDEQINQYVLFSLKITQLLICCMYRYVYLHTYMHAYIHARIHSNVSRILLSYYCMNGYHT